MLLAKNHLDLAQFHRKLLGVDPFEEQLQLYQSSARGFIDDGYNHRRMQAIFFLALYLAQPSEDKEAFRKVFLIFPPTHEKWAIEMIRVITKAVLTITASDKETYKLVSNCIVQLQMGHRVFRIPEPDLWVTYGFNQDTPIPEWMARKTIKVEDNAFPRG